MATLLLGCGRIGFSEQPGPADDAMPLSDTAAPAGFSQLVAFADQTCAVLDGRARCWAANNEGQLGDGTTTDRAVPTEVLLPAGVVTRISQGDIHDCAIVDRHLYCMGNAFAPEPMPVPFNDDVTDVGCGRDFTCASRHHTLLGYQQRQPARRHHEHRSLHAGPDQFTADLRSAQRR